MRIASALALALTSCTAVADFPLDRLDESTDGLCANGVDDDADGLADCQDWKCLDRDVCCTEPAVVLEDAFEGEECALDACAAETRACAPDPARWQRWGAPYPYLCEGALQIGKDYATCYPVGVLSVDAVAVTVGLRVEAQISGVPEEAGRLDVALTRQTTAIDGADPCASIARVPTMFGVIVAADGDGGVRVIAEIDDTPVAQAEVTRDPFEVSFSVRADRTIEFAVDDVVFAASPDPIPDEVMADAHLVAAGLGSQARLEHVRVVTGTRCDEPAAWRHELVTPIPAAAPGAWDAYERRSPSASIDDDDRVHLRYVGCRPDQTQRCDPLGIALGDSSTAAGTPFPPQLEPWLSAEALALGYFGSFVFTVTEDERRIYFGGDGDGLDGIQRAPIDGTTEEIFDAVEPVLEAGSSDAWDGGGVCCPAIVGDRLWYAGHAVGDPVWHLGFARRATGDALFTRVGRVLEHATEPTVVWDDVRGMYRLWYTSAGALGSTAIGYAVSLDGESWSPFPSNPVITADDLGLLSVGHPTVVDDGGQLRMWIDGQPPGSTARTIYELRRE